MKTKKVLFGLLLISCVCGCSSSVKVTPGKPLCVLFKDKERFMEVCEDVLHGMSFDVEKYDVKSGYIKTRPLRGGQFFEFWRRDNVGSGNTAEANIQSVLQTVELRIFPSGAEFCVSCQTQTRRLSIPEEEIVGFTENPGIFTGGTLTMQKLRPKNIRDLEWVETGPDHALENRILERIDKKVSKLNP